MREMKFRAWMRNQGYMAFGYPNLGNHHFYEIEGSRFPGLGTDFRVVEIMEWTGLQDKNGKDIYEGDLLRYAIQGDTQAALMEVKLPEFFIELGHDDQYYLPDKESFVVIGNVYEHSHLLKEEHEQNL